MPAHAQTDTDSQVWTTVEASTALDDGVKLTLEAIGRFGDDADGLYELEFGGWLGFDAGDGVTISTGYVRSEEHTSELQSLMRISYAVFCLKKKKSKKQSTSNDTKKIKHSIITINI